MKIGLALSGGGIKGIAHAGVLKAFEDNNIKIDMISGTSSGSMVAILYSMGYSPYYIYILFKKYAKYICEINKGKIMSGIGDFLFSKKLSTNGIKSGEEIVNSFNTIAKRNGINKIEDIDFPVYITTVDILDGKKYIFSSEKENNNITDIDIGKAIYASCAFPIIFKPCKYKNHLFVDGGVLENIPTEILKEKGADQIISISFKEEDIKNENSILEIGFKSLEIMGKKNQKTSMDLSNLNIKISLENIGLFDIDKIDLCYRIGYETGIKEIAKLKRLIA